MSRPISQYIQVYHQAAPGGGNRKLRARTPSGHVDLLNLQMVSLFAMRVGWINHASQRLLELHSCETITVVTHSRDTKGRDGGHSMTSMEGGNYASMKDLGMAPVVEVTKGCGLHNAAAVMEKWEHVFLSCHPLLRCSAMARDAKISKINHSCRAGILSFQSWRKLPTLRWGGFATYPKSLHRRFWKTAAINRLHF